MSSSKLSIVMFSALLSHGGGRETWLNNIVPKLLAMQVFTDIEVYYVADASTDAHDKIGIVSDPRVRFIETRLPVGAGKLVSLWRIAIFCAQVTRKLRRQASAGHYVIGIGTFYEGAIVRLLRLLSRRPPTLVVWIRGVWSKEINHRHGKRVRDLICWFERMFMHSADRIISNGQDTKAFYEQLLGRHVEAIPNALDIDKYAAIGTIAFSSEQKVVSFIGRLSEEKGLRGYLAAIRLYLQGQPSPHLVFDIVGDGPLRALVEQFVAENGSAVRYLGPMANEAMLDYLATIDAGVCLTYSKESGGGGVSNGLLELIGAGRLVIAWDSPIYRQVLNTDQAAFVEEADDAALAGAFAAVAGAPATMAAKVAASAAALTPYSLEHHVHHFVDYVRP